MAPLATTTMKPGSEIFSDSSSGSSSSSAASPTTSLHKMPPLPRSRTGSPKASSPANSPRGVVSRKAAPPSPPSTPLPRPAAPFPPPPSSSNTAGTHAHSNHRRRSSSEESLAPSEETLQKLERAVRQSVRKHGEHHETTAGLYNQLGNANFRLGRLDAAVAAYKKAVEAASPGDHLVSAFSNLGTCHWKTGNCEEAVRMLEQARQVLELVLAERDESPEESLQAASIYHQLGVCHCLMGDSARALQRLEDARAVRVRCGVPIASTLDAMGKVHLLERDYDRALACHRQALAIRFSAGTLRDVAHVHRAAGRPEEAVRVLRQAAAAQPRGTPAHQQVCSTLAQWCEELGDVDEAAQWRTHQCCL